jgi:hypothetical protein
MTNPRPVIGQSSALTVVRTAPCAPASILSPKVNSFEQSVTHALLWINPVSRAPSYGGLQVFTGAQLTSPPRHVDSYLYTLDFAIPPGIIPPQHFTAHSAGLATVAERYVQDVGSGGGLGVPGQYPAPAPHGVYRGPGPAGAAACGPGAVPVGQPAHALGNTSSEYRSITSGHTPGGQTSAFRLLHAGQHLAQTWNAYTLCPGHQPQLPRTPA